MKNSLKYVKFNRMPYCFPYEEDEGDNDFDVFRSFMILNLFIKVDKEMEINGIKYSFVSDLGRPNHIGAWVALPRKEIEKHIPKGSAVSELLIEELVDMTLNAIPISKTKKNKRD